MVFSTIYSAGLHEFFSAVTALGQYHIGQRLLIVVLYAAFAKLTDLFIDKLLKRLASRTKITGDDLIIEILHRPIYVSIFLLGLLHALFTPPALTPPWNTVLPDLIKTILLLFWWSALLRGLNRLHEVRGADFMQRKHIDKDLLYLIKNISRVILIFAGMAWVLIIWRVDLTPLFASAGIAGIAIALAAKDTMANFFGGISIFADQAYKVGDYIILDSGERGEVIEMGVRSTKIKTRDDVQISIPNAIMANSKIINESAPIPRFRIRIAVGVAYGSDLEKVERILLGIARGNTMLARTPEPRVRVRAFAESSVKLQLLVWVIDPAQKGLQTHHLLIAIYKAFAEQNIVIPFPQRDIHMRTGAGTRERPPVRDERT